MDDTYEYTKNFISNNSILNIDLRHLEVVREKAREKSCINLNYNTLRVRVKYHCALSQKESPKLPTYSGRSYIKIRAPVL